MNEAVGFSAAAALERMPLHTLFQPMISARALPREASRCIRPAMALCFPVPIRWPTRSQEPPVARRLALQTPANWHTCSERRALSGSGSNSVLMMLCSSDGE